MRCAVYRFPNNPALAYSPSPLGLRCNMVWRSLASSAGYGPVSMVIVIVVGMFVDTALLACASCSLFLADWLQIFFFPDISIIASQMLNIFLVNFGDVLTVEVVSRSSCQYLVELFG